MSRPRDHSLNPMNYSEYWNRTPLERQAMMNKWKGKVALPDSAELSRRAMGKGGPGNILTKAAEIGFEIAKELSKKR